LHNPLLTLQPLAHNEDPIPQLGSIPEDQFVPVQNVLGSHPSVKHTPLIGFGMQETYVLHNPVLLLHPAKHPELIGVQLYGHQLCTNTELMFEEQ
jgi:hypothetical protein